MSETNTKIENTLERVKELRVDALYGKKKHFNAADRKQNYDSRLGIGAIILNLIVGSLLFGLASQQFPVFWGWVGAALVLVSIILTSIQTYYHFQRQADGHKRIANRYLDIAKECGRIEAYIKDGDYSLDKVREQLETLSQKCSQVNFDAEPFSTNGDDYKKAQENFRIEETYTPDELEYKGE